MDCKLQIRLSMTPPEPCFATYLLFGQHREPFLVGERFYHTTMEIRRWLKRAEAHGMPIEFQSPADLVYADLAAEDPKFSQFAAWFRQQYPQSHDVVARSLPGSP